jgi:DNA-binding MarR family transcriptional regulator
MPPRPPPTDNYVAAIEFSRGANELIEEVPPLKLMLLYALGASDPPPTVSELGLVINEDIKTTSRGLAVLRRRGWVKTVGDLHDTRKRRVRLTRAGETVVAALHAALVGTAFRIVDNEKGQRPPSRKESPVAKNTNKE